MNSSESEETCEYQVKQNFPNWEQDKEFGGKKFLLKVEFTDYENIKFITIGPNKSINEFIVDSDFDFLKKYMCKLFQTKTIEDNGIYNLYNKSFIKQIDRYKKKIKIILSGDNEKLISKKWTCNDCNIVEQLFGNNAIINNLYYASEMVSQLDNTTTYLHVCTIHLSLYIHYIKINRLNYDKQYLREHLPYIISENNYQEFYMINRDYEYIGMKTKSIDTNNTWTRIYLFNDRTCPWHGKTNFTKYNKKLKQIITNQTCLNPNTITEMILDL